MTSFDWKKHIEDSIKDGLIINAATTGIFFALKAENIKPPKASLDGNGYHETYRWNLCRSIGQRLCSLQKIDQRVIQQKFYNPYRIVKLHDGYENMRLIL